MRVRCLIALVMFAASCTTRPPDVVQEATVYPPIFRAFILLNNLEQEVQAFERLLKRNDVDDVLPIDALLLQGTEWQSRGHSAYALPPRTQWSAMVKTLQFIKSELIPVIGAVEVMSGYRSLAYNRAAGGAPRSRHLVFSALDLKPQQTIARRDLHSFLKRTWAEQGAAWDLGLGLYSGLRFHVDTGGYRTW